MGRKQSFASVRFRPEAVICYVESPDETKVSYCHMHDRVVQLDIALLDEHQSLLWKQFGQLSRHSDGVRTLMSDNNKLESEKMGKIKIKEERKQITYADHWNASRLLLERGTENQKGSYYQFLASIVFIAFTLEAFLNHIGQHIFSSWEDLEKLTPKAKVNIICEKLGIKVNYGVLPWQIIPEILGIRNKIAHGKSSLLKEEAVIPHTDNYDEIMHMILLADWQKYTSRANAERAQTEIEKVLTEIFKKSGIKNERLFDLGIQTGEARFVED